MLRLNPELFKNCKEYSDMVGDLGYMYLFSFFGFLPVKEEEHPTRGTIVFCTINQIDKKAYEIVPKIKSMKWEGQLALLKKDLIKANDIDFA